MKIKEKTPTQQRELNLIDQAEITDQDGVGIKDELERLHIYKKIQLVDMEIYHREMVKLRSTLM